MQPWQTHPHISYLKSDQPLIISCVRLIYLNQLDGAIIDNRPSLINLRPR
jgi:hypothetical protein